jgi:hypothetical protein
MVWNVLVCDTDTGNKWKVVEVFDTKYDANRATFGYLNSAPGRNVAAVHADDLHLYLGRE